MNILIVDDDRYIIDGIKAGVNWDALPITNIFYATSVREAKEIIGSVLIHILLCDIEMPRETGLDLLAWIRSRSMNIACIFMTGYADFNYAQRALALGTIEYFLKPIKYDKLTNVLLSVSRKIQEQEQGQYLQLLGRYWEENEMARKSYFWARILSWRTQHSDEALMQLLGKHRLDYSDKDRFLIVALNQKKDNVMERRLIEMQQISIENSFRLLVEPTACALETVWQESPELTIGILLLHRDLERSEMEKGTRQMFHSLRRAGVEGTLYYARPTLMADAWLQNRQLRQLIFHNLYNKDEALFLEDYSHLMPQEECYDRTKLEQLLVQGDLNGLNEYIHQMVYQLESQKTLSTSAFQNLLLHWQQRIFSYLYKRHIEADVVFSSQEYHLLYEKVSRSAADFENYLKYITSAALTASENDLKEDDVVKKLKEYISCHLQENITRATLSEVVYLNSDYLAQLFKRSTGCTLLKYINNERLDRAYELLLSTDLPVYQVAENVGFQTGSYFARQFKERFQIGPNELRRRGTPENSAT